MKSKFEKSKIEQEYKPSEIESKWQKIWENNGIYSPNLDTAKKPFYNLMMFPYPSAEGMHVGNMYAFTGADVYGRFMRMQGFDVFEPIGLDGFGIHSENYAIKVGRHPKEQSKLSESNFYRQLKATGNGFDWSRKLETYDPKYYKWTQWLFIQLFKAGLAYRKKAPVNFCPSCKTVLADEQVVHKLSAEVAHENFLVRNAKKALPLDSTTNPANAHSENFVGSPRSKVIIEDRIGVCERCETPVEKKELEQWFFRITKYAERLLANIAKLDWSEKVKIAQKQWIGKSEGATIRFRVILNSFQDPKQSRREILNQTQSDQHDIEYIEVFTTRPDTLFGATFLVLSPEHPITEEILKQVQDDKVKSQVKQYIKESRKRSEQEGIEGREKTGIFSGLYGTNPVSNEEIPIWIADYVLMEYGTGAIMGVPAHDERDFEFAKKYNLLIKNVIASEAKQSIIVNSGEWNGWKMPEQIGKVIDWLEKKRVGKREITYHLRDWLISRQRYWGPPIPMIYCEVCAKKGNSGSSLTKKSSTKEDYLVNLKADSLNGWPDTLEAKILQQRIDVNSQFKKGMDSPGVEPGRFGVSSQPSRPAEPTPESVYKNDDEFVDGWSSAGWFPVPEKDLPVLLPDVKDWKPKGTGKSPLASVESFVNTKCPNCKSPAKRETDVSDTFLDSAWYFFRYASTDIDSTAFDIKRVKKWLPVKMYIGGAEHSVLHLLYSRFITMALYDLGFISFEEPFSRFYAHGLLIKEGSKMSKSKGNVVAPDQYIKKYGADTLRMYLMFLGPFSQGGDFYDTGIEGMSRFVKRVWRFVQKVLGIKYKVLSINNDEAQKLEQFMHKTIKLVSEDLQGLRYNTAIAHIMEYYNSLHKFYTKYKILNTKYCKTLVLLMAPFAPHITEELFQQFFRNSKSEIRNPKFQSIHLQPWPKYEPKLLEEQEVTIVVQVNGKVRDTIKVQKSKVKDQDYVEQLAKESDKVKRHLKGKTVKRVVYVEGRIINFVTA